MIMLKQAPSSPHAKIGSLESLAAGGKHMNARLVLVSHPVDAIHAISSKKCHLALWGHELTQSAAVGITSTPV